MIKDVQLIDQFQNLKEEYLTPNASKSITYELNSFVSSDLWVHRVHDISSGDTIYCKVSSEDFRNELPAYSFLSQWRTIKDQPNHKQRMYKTVYMLPASKAPKRMALPEWIEELLAPTDGYLLYQEQIEALLKHVRGVQPNQIRFYIRNWNLKKPGTRLMAASASISGPKRINLDELIEDRIYDTIHQFFYH